MAILSTSKHLSLRESGSLRKRMLLAVVVLLSLSLCFVLALINTFIHHEQQHHHTFYGTNKYIVVSLAEVIKLACCISLYVAVTKKVSDASDPAASRFGLATVVRYTTLKEALAYCIPAVVYLIENNSIFVALDLLDSPATFQLLLNMKIIITALLFRYFLGRSLSTAQFVCTVLCAIGLCIAVIASGTEWQQQLVAAGDEGLDRQSSRWVWIGYRCSYPRILGASIVSGIALISSFSNIWVEYLFQDRDKEIPFLLRNSRIYMWGAPLNSIAVVAAAIVTGEAPTIEAFKAALGAAGSEAEGISRVPYAKVHQPGLSRLSTISEASDEGSEMSMGEIE
ncbi:sugar transporter, putative [Perkinsus marinus ATCC 50983]|uniref:Sugar transporter, putative n=1 Tax=Perkinsus marinus (strain ATCC 50983 / TXsc) TaxID=423536 RepID=C5KQS2_PERM5|nr:sugar transporter, putative [Perkinsus marinus ATCC 50983]EER13168.1 sugar transporter, putative [Perkinsus marinus ATCC 50983]|eukprot:XP_002781373.1 sugar transporter, putative [Perkinsus marinus ATCC 50983]